MSRISAADKEAPWSDAERDLAFQLFEVEGYSGSQVAKILVERGFPHRTRSAVCGKIHRIRKERGLTALPPERARARRYVAANPRRDKIAKSAKPAEPKASKPAGACDGAPPPDKPKRYSWKLTGAAADAERAERRGEVAAIFARIDAPTTDGVSARVEDGGAKHCAWIVGADRVCAGRRERGLFCAAHYPMAYREAPNRWAPKPDSAKPRRAEGSGDPLPLDAVFIGRRV